MGKGSSKAEVNPMSEEEWLERHSPPEFIEDSSQRVVLITGCSTGIGLAIAALLANDEQKRFKVYATMRNLEKKEALEEAAKDVLGELLIVKELDVCFEDSVKSVVKDILEKEQRIDILVNNAGLALFSPAESVSIDLIKKIYNTNVFGLMHVTNEVIPNMKTRESGHIVHISCAYGLVGLPFGEYYASSKFAVEGYAESLAPVLQKFNIKTTIIEPGPVSTQFAANAKAMREQVDITTADDKTIELMKETLMSYYKSTVNAAHESSEIAECVKDVLLLKNPHFRYQPHPTYRYRELRTKFNDRNGDQLMRLFAQDFASHDY